MSSAELKVKLHDEIEHSDDRLLKMIYALIKEYQTDTDSVAEMREKLVLAEREKYIKGEGQSYTWEEVKNMAINRQKPNRA